MVPVSMIAPAKVSRSTMAAHRRWSVKVLVQPLNGSLEAMVEHHQLGRAEVDQAAATGMEGDERVCESLFAMTPQRPGRPSAVRSRADHPLERGEAHFTPTPRPTPQMFPTASHPSTVRLRTRIQQRLLRKTR